MLDLKEDSFKVDCIASRTIVSLRVLRNDETQCQARLHLAEPLHCAGVELSSLWQGPGHWLLVSDRLSAAHIIEQCTAALTHLEAVHVVDSSAALAVFRLEGSDIFQVLAAGCGLDLRPSAFKKGAAWRTRLAMLRATVVSIDHQTVDVYIDRSQMKYFGIWLNQVVKGLQ